MKHRVLDVAGITVLNTIWVPAPYENYQEANVSQEDMEGTK
jgi:hypothetical protein